MNSRDLARHALRRTRRTVRAFRFLPVLAFLIGCNGATETESQNPAPPGTETGKEASGGDPKGPTTTPSPRKPEAVGSLPEAENMAPLHLYVSNQSFDMGMVDIDVYVDGVKLVTGDFKVENQHNWVHFEFNAEAGKTHTIRAVSKNADAERTKEVEVPASGRWVIVDFWYENGVDAIYDPHFTIEAFDEEPRFA